MLPFWPDDEEARSDETLKHLRAALLDEFPNEDAYHTWFLQLVGIPPGSDPYLARAELAIANAEGIRLKGNGYGYERAFTRSPHASEIAKLHRLASLRSGSSDAPSLLDPFAGGGSIPFEAMRLGCDVIANELNPVASAVLQSTLGVVHDFGTALADDIQTWGARWAKSVQGKLQDYFPQITGQAISGYIWAFCVPCPTTGRPTPLAPNLWLAQGVNAKTEYAVDLRADAESGLLEIRIVAGAEASAYGDRATYRNGVGVSVWADGTTFSGEYIQAQVRAGKGTYLLLAVAVQEATVKGKSFRLPTQEDLNSVAMADERLAQNLPIWEVNDLVPNERIGPGHKTDELLRMGITDWSRAFLPRQLLSNVTIMEELLALEPSMKAELGAERARALMLQLSFGLSRCLNYNSRLTLWHSKQTMIANTFARHDFAFSWTCAEFDAATQLLPWIVEKSASIHRQMSKIVRGDVTRLNDDEPLGRPTVIRGSAVALPLASGSVDVIVTDPPYYDNVMYAELSDFFYVWLKRSLRDSWPEFCDLLTTEKVGEAVANPSLFRDLATHAGRGKRTPGTFTASELATRHYEQLLTESFVEAHRVLSDRGVLNVMFTHKRVEAWDTLGAALLNSGFAITSSWPIATESENSLHQAKKNSAQSTILLNCHKRGTTAAAYWADIRHEVGDAAVEAVKRFSGHGLRGVDLTLATYGPVLAVLSRNWPVYTGELDREGNPETLRPDTALDLAREKVASLKKRDLLGGRDVEFDRVTDWWLLAWSDFQAAEFPAGEALKLSLATHLDLETLSKTHKLIKAAAGKVTLLTPAQRRTANGLDVNASSYGTLVDALHALMLIYDEDGVRAAQTWLDRHGLGDDVRFEALVGAALHAVPRRKQKGVFVRPEARSLDSLRTSFFEGLAVPPDPDLLVRSSSQTLF